MSEIEKVIKGLECCIESDRSGRCPEDCPYEDNGEDRCETIVKINSLKLLKRERDDK